MVQTFREPRFLARGGIAVNDPLLRRRIQFGLRLPNERRGVRFARLNRADRSFDDRARLGFDQAVALAAPRVFAYFFFGGICISQFEFLRFTIPIRNPI